MNKHMGFASIVLSSKSPPSMATALTNHVLRHAASRGPTASAGYHFDFSKAVRGKRADSDSKSGSLHHPTHQQEDGPTRSSDDEERGNLITVERNHAGDGTAEPDVSRLTTLGVIKGERRVGGTPRSLMGRMLGSGMLERQREWANERMRKVMPDCGPVSIILGRAVDQFTDMNPTTGSQRCLTFWMRRWLLECATRGSLVATCLF